MSLKFLAKKSWHTTNIKNVEQVWIAEQKVAAEQKKLAELQKQIQEERQIQELRELQVASGQVVRNTDTTMDWMYEGPAAQQQQFGEDYLLGKVYKPDAGGGSATAGVDLRKERDPGALWMSKVNAKNDSFTRLHEDPLLAIRKQEKTVREDIVHNPVKMARIKHRIAEELAKSESKKSKKEKKEKKSHKESKKHSKHKKDSRGRSNSRSASPDPRHHRDSRRRDSSTSSRSRSRSSSVRDHNRRPRDDRKRQRSPSLGSARRRHDSRSPDRAYRRDDRRDRDYSPRRDDKRPRAEDERRVKSSGDKSYGLVKHGGVPAVEVKSRGSLGPDIELLKKKEAADAEKNDWRKRLNKDGAKKLTEEEKQRRIEEMERDALISEMKRKKVSEVVVGNGDPELAKGSGPNAEFIKSMRSEVYNNQDLDSSAAMEDRMRRNRHYQQSSSDFDKGFMKV